MKNLLLFILFIHLSNIGFAIDSKVSLNGKQINQSTYNLKVGDKLNLKCTLEKKTTSSSNNLYKLFGSVRRI